MLVPPAVAFDLSDWTQIDVSGSAANAFIHNFCTNDIKGLAHGRSTEAFFCDIKGRILGHAQIWGLEGRLRMITVPGASETLLHHLKKYRLVTDVDFVDRSEELGLICLSGEDVPAVLRETLPIEEGLASGEVLERQIRGKALVVAATSMVQSPAVLISGPRETLENWREQIPDAVLAIGMRELFNLQRIQAGFPWVGRDVGPENIAQEAARTAQAISFSKGCYLGQEPIARLDALGHTNKELRVLKIQDDSVEAGSPVFCGDQPAGMLTSVAIAIEPGESYGLGLVKTKFNAPATVLQVRTPHGDRAAVVQ